MMVASVLKGGTAAILKAALLLSSSVALPATAVAQEQRETLREGFTAPPAEARPWTWFHVMSGNMSREGITKDLESLAEVGVGGIVLFHVTQGIAHGTVRFNSPEHQELITHVAAECERLGLAFNFHNADGWSSSGGPWITPEQSMKRVVWSSALTQGGRVSMPLAQPPSREGFYRDIAVIAYPALAGEQVDAALRPVVTASDPAFDVVKASDGDPNTLTKLSGTRATPGWIQFSYDEPVGIRSVAVDNSPTRGLAAALQTSADGEVWEQVAELGTLRTGKFEWVVDESFAAVTAQHFRITMPANIEMGEVSLSAVPRIPKLALHTSLAQGSGLQLPVSLEASAEATIDPAQIIDLTANLDDKGQLTARLPEGAWTIMRFGYTSTGATNVIASPEGTGLEVDKFSPDAFMAHYDAFIGPVIERARAVAPNALTGVMIDSYEVGGQNWTQGYDAMFAQRFGQSVIPWLPVYTGRLVSSPAETRAKLADIRAFNAELMRDKYYGTFAKVMEQQGLESIVQPYGMGPYNDVDVGSTVTIPTGEFWMGRLSVQLNDAVSAGRLYDRKMIAAEAFTAQDEVNWRFSPALGKKWGDRAWIAGVNQFMFHRFAHQANTHVMPGMTMFRYGSHFDRTQTWWDGGGKAWFDYMARGHYLLRQGLPVVDIAMFVGEDSPVTCQEKHNFIERLPIGAEFDCLNAETLLSRSRFVDGQMELPNGARYPMIWWPHGRTPGAAAEARMLEARAAGVPVAMEHLGDDPKEVFAKAGLSPRIVAQGALPLFTQRRVGETDIFFLLNFADKDEVYDLAIAAGGKAPELWDPVTGAITPLPATVDETGRTRFALSLLDGQSAFLLFDPANSFVPAAEPTKPARKAVQDMAGPWTISFDPKYGDAGTITSPALFDLSTSDIYEVRHYSGPATYRHSFSWRGQTGVEAGPIMLDLGQVEVAATVRLNGVDLGTLWTAPFALDVSKAIRKGDNVLEIEVANLWINRLIGDAGLENTSGFTPEERWPTTNMVDWYSANQPPPPGPRRTFATQDFFEADDPLVPSGLIGPVQIMIENAPN